MYTFCPGALTILAVPPVPLGRTAVLDLSAVVAGEASKYQL